MECASYGDGSADGTRMKCASYGAIAGVFGDDREGRPYARGRTYLYGRQELEGAFVYAL